MPSVLWRRGDERLAMLNAKQVGPLLGLSPRKVYELARSGTLPSYRFGDAVRFAPEDVETYRTSCRSTGTSRQAAGALTLTAGLAALASVAASSFPQAGREPKPTRSTARKARPCTRSRKASPALGTPLVRLSICT